MRHQKNKLVKKSQPRLKPVSRMLKASLIGLGLAHTSAQAATLLVTSSADNGSGGCTLREALDSVNAGSAIGGCMDVVPPLNNFGVQDTVLIPGTTFPNNTITLNGSELSVTNPVTVNGFEGLVIDGNLQSPVFNVDDAALILNNVTISRGLGGIRGRNSDIRINQSTISNNVAQGAQGAQGANDGGGVSLYNGSLILESSTVTDNTATRSGGISLYQTYGRIVESRVTNNQARSFGGITVGGFASRLVIEDSSVSNNTATEGSVGGIRIRNDSILILTNSSVTNNRAGSFGSAGGISVGQFATLTASNSIISGNTTGYYGGGIYAVGSANLNTTIDLTNSTIANNSAGYKGGGIFATSASLTLGNSTVSLNNRNQIHINTGVLNLANTIIADATGNGSGDCFVNAGSINTDSATIVADGSCNTQRAIDPQLGPLADNGGKTLTMALKPNSPARNTGILATCEIRDQRNQLRDDGDGACDVGAIEFNQSDDFGEEDSFFVIPLKNKKAVIVPL